MGARRGVGEDETKEEAGNRGTEEEQEEEEVVVEEGRSSRGRSRVQLARAPTVLLVANAPGHVRKLCKARRLHAAVCGVCRHRRRHSAGQNAPARHRGHCQQRKHPARTPSHGRTECRHRRSESVCARGADAFSVTVPEKKRKEKIMVTVLDRVSPGPSVGSGRAMSSPLVTKLEALRVQRDMLQQEVADIRRRDRELAQHSHSAQSSPAAGGSSVHTPGTPGALAEQLEAGLRALSQPARSPLAEAVALASPAAAPDAHAAASAAWSVQRMPGASASPSSASPAAQSQLSIDELRTMVASSISQLGSRAHTPSAATTPGPTVLLREPVQKQGAVNGSVSRALPPVASAPLQPHRSSPPRPKGPVGPVSRRERIVQESHVRLPARSNLLHACLALADYAVS